MAALSVQNSVGGKNPEGVAQNGEVTLQHYSNVGYILHGGSNGH
jgi:hypothetical protein